ncbi:phage antirepressor protein [Nitrosomonas sp. Is79A3]|uniref:phage antirepressor KilAC domain-containing protein n=1 Tax=Nitrosomonas sp. (strain Is79A3) TaxID=261292 RepID=UPI000215CFE5
MSEIAIHNGKTVTMTSIELVEFINSQRGDGEAILAHSDFLKKVLQVLGEKDAGNFSGIYKDSMNRKKPCYVFPKREACLMAMSYSYELQAKVYDRMTGLETQPTIDYAKLSKLQILQLAMESEQERLALEHKVVELAPKAKALDRIATHSEGSFCIRDAAKTLQVKEKVLKQTLVERSWIYRRPMGSGYLAYSEKLKRGLMEHKIIRGERPDGSEWVETQARITARGMALLSEIFSSELAFG